jgi:heterodisulfide reductase subunit A
VSSHDRVRHEGVLYRKGHASGVRRGDHLAVRAETCCSADGGCGADLVVLAVASPRKMRPRWPRCFTGPGCRFFAEDHPKVRTVESSQPGIYLAGCCQGPKDIPDTVAHAKAAASAAMILLAQTEKAMVTSYAAN